MVICQQRMAGFGLRLILTMLAGGVMIIESSSNDGLIFASYDHHQTFIEIVSEGIKNEREQVEVYS